MIHRWRSCHGLSGLHGRCKPTSRMFGAVHLSRASRYPSPRLQTGIPKSTFHTTVPLWGEHLRNRRKDIVPTADTIYALSTAAGRAAIAVVRVSGPACLDIYGSLCPNRPFPHPRIATLRKLRDPENHKRILDNGALVLYFPGPNTVTGDDVLEFHVHGGPAIVKSVLDAIPKCYDSRPRRRTAEYSLIRAAEPGEFTKRAFYNGRLDLTQAEALGETLAAETEQQRRLAIAGANSGLASRYEEWKKTLLYARGELEALIDFSEDQHFDESPAEFMRSITAQVIELDRKMKLHISNASRGELLRNGISVALLGMPNAGKSSLLNLIVGREAAIVSAEAGTTRDIVDVNVDIGGWLVRLGDMAGLRGAGNDVHELHMESSESVDTIGQVEREGIRRAKERALQSDLVIIIISLVRNNNGAIKLSINPELIEAVQQCHVAGKTSVFVVNKVDLFVGSEQQNQIDTVSGLRQNVLDVFPAAAHQGNIFLLSCKDAASSSSQPTLSSSIPKVSDPGGVQTFLTGLSNTFNTMTSAETDPDSAQSLVAHQFTPAEANSYWSASLSVTHRQSTYLQRCRTHLGDFLAHCTMPRAAADTDTDADTETDMNIGMNVNTDRSSSVNASHHVDEHDDLVGEIVVGDRELRNDVDDHFDVVTAAEHLRYAADCLAKVTGRGQGGDVEDVLGVVFEK